MKDYVILLCILGAITLAVGVFCLSPGKRAEQACHRGTTDLQDGLLPDALTDFSHAIQLNPKLAKAYLGRAEARFGLGDLTNAATDCGVVIELEPTNERAFFISGAAKFKLKDFDGAVGDLGKAISLNTRDVDACFIRGVAELHTRDWDGSKADLTKTLRLNPYYPKAFLARSLVEMRLHEYENAVLDASNAIPSDIANAPEAYCLRAHAWADLKDRGRAFADLNQAIDINPKYPTAYETRATCNILWDDFSSASNDIQTLAQLRAPAKTIFLCRGVLEHKLRQTAAATADFSQALALEPDPIEAPEYHDSLGHLAEDASNWPQALKEYQEGMAYKSPPGQMRFELYLTQCRLGQTSQAQNDLNTYIQSIPSSKTNDWTTSIAHFLAGNLDETNFLAQATTTATRPTDIAGQICDAYYYEGMQHLLAGDKAGALPRFQKSIDTHDDNSLEYMSAFDEVNALKNP